MDIGQNDSSDSDDKEQESTKSYSSINNRKEQKRSRVIAQVNSNKLSTKNQLSSDSYWDDDGDSNNNNLSWENKYSPKSSNEITIHSTKVYNNTPLIDYLYHFVIIIIIHCLYINNHISYIETIYKGVVRK